ncbi:MAG TPA: UvrB/UvrC motif-containing protein [Verrucomicrobiae bacterium]|nr:UvrB/UvrC motif-containing protein [Verrucomicrobiae bacterium]
MANRPPGCENCKEPATIHLTQIINGVVHKIDLCAKCPNAKNIDDPTGFSLADQLLGLGAAEEMKANGDELACPKCGFTQNDFKKSGRLGCPVCYETFRQGLEPLLRNMHRGTSHKGKIPARHQDVKELRNRLDSLESELKKAINREDYEGAASLRDRIRELEIKLSG